MIVATADDTSSSNTTPVSTHDPNDAWNAIENVYGEVDRGSCGSRIDIKSSVALLKKTPVQMCLPIFVHIPVLLG